jgi:hypothetical protein
MRHVLAGEEVSTCAIVEGRTPRNIGWLSSEIADRIDTVELDPTLDTLAEHQ